MISNNAKGKVDVFIRDFAMTVRQIVEKFGVKPGSRDIDWSNISAHVKNQWMTRNYETWIYVSHVIMPNNLQFDPRKLEAKYKRFKSVYYETGSQSSSGANYLGDDDQIRYLSKSGYDLFPVLAPRWEVNAEDAYGTNCPGMIALGDIKQLNSQNERDASHRKMVNPPMVAPVALRHGKVSILPGDVTYDPSGDMKGFRPAYQIDPRINELEMKNQQIQQRISRAFFEDLFLMPTNTDRREITAREIDERHEEKLLALGPVLEQLNQDLLDPLIDITFNYLNNQGQFLLRPKNLKAFRSKSNICLSRSQAQKLVAIGGIDRFSVSLDSSLRIRRIRLSWTK